MMAANENLERLRLTYFGVRGSCDKIRLLLAAAALPYEEISIEARDFVKMKTELEFGELPLLEDGDLRIVHANAIFRHLARKVSMYGATTQEAARCDMWLEQCDVIQQALWNADFMQGEHSPFKEKEMKDNFTASYLVPQLLVMTRLMRKNETVFLVGDKLSCADIALFSLLESIDRELPLVLPSLPILAFYHSTIKQLPRLAEFYFSPRRF